MSFSLSSFRADFRAFLDFRQGRALKAEACSGIAEQDRIVSLTSISRLQYLPRDGTGE